VDRLRMEGDGESQAAKERKKKTRVNRSLLKKGKGPKRAGQRTGASAGEKDGCF